MRLRQVFSRPFCGFTGKFQGKVWLSEIIVSRRNRRTCLILFIGIKQALCFLAFKNLQRPGRPATADAMTDTTLKRRKTRTLLGRQAFGGFVIIRADVFVIVSGSRNIAANRLFRIGCRTTAGQGQFINAWCLRKIGIFRQPVLKFLVTRTVGRRMQISLRHHMPHQDIIIQARNQAVRIFPAALLLHGKNLFVKFCVTLGKCFWE